MPLGMSDVLLTVIHSVSLATLLGSTYVQYGKKKTGLNALATAALLLTVNSTVPQYFLLGRTAGQCAFLHHWAGSFYFLTNGLVKGFFLARSNMVASDRLGTFLMGAVTVATTLAILGYNLLSGTAINENGVCIFIPNYIFSVAFLFTVPITLDLVINARFVYHILLSTSNTATTASHKEAPMRLLRITCLMSLSSIVVSLSAMLCVIGVIRVPEWLLTPLLVVEQSYNAWTTLWPAMLVRVLKRGHRSSQPGGGSKFVTMKSTAKPSVAANSVTASGQPFAGEASPQA